MIRVGMRFARTDAPLLQELAERVRQGDLGEQHVSTFENAAIAARTGEPLIVHCTAPIEAEILADGYVRYGVRRPALDELTGLRPAN